MLGVFHSGIFNSEQVMLIKYACFAIILEITSLQKRSNKRVLRFLCVTTGGDTACPLRYPHHHLICPKHQQIKRKPNKTLRSEGFLSPFVDKRSNLFLYLRPCCSAVYPLLRPTCPRSISYSPERQSSSCPQPIIHHHVLWVWAQDRSNEQQSYLSASRGREAEFKLVMNFVYEQQVALKPTYNGLV